MPKITDTPDTLKPYVFHGVQLRWSEGDTNAVGLCPFCSRADKFGVNLADTTWNCYPCGESGNGESFVSHLWEASDRDTTSYKTLAENRGIHPETLMHWGAAKSVTTGEWVVPGYNVDGQVKQLYRYAGGKLLATPKLGHQLFGVNLFDKDKRHVILCEGPWDAMSLWETLKETEEGEEGYTETASPHRNMLEDINVLGVPGCTTFLKAWTKLTAKKIVTIWFDNDHPRKHPKTGKKLPPAGWTGVQRIAKVLRGAKVQRRPNEVRYLHWGDEGYDPSMANGLDVRDMLTTK